MTTPSPDPRITAFCDPRSIDVFSAVAHAHQVWTRDPFDVEAVHAEARSVFTRLVDRIATPIQQDHGRILLIRGESGSGKTHLMRAFRAYLHGRRQGYAAYMQMSSRADDYARLLLANMVDSLERPYDLPAVGSSGLVCLSDGLVDLVEVDPADRERLREGDVSGDDLAMLVRGMVDRILRGELFRQVDFDPDVLHALLYLQRHDPPIKARVLKYLRCEPLNAYDQKVLGDVTPRTQAGDAERMLEQLGKLMWSVHQAALVILVDQLEDIYNQDEAKERFPRLIDALRRVVDHMPSAVVVIACLDDYYQALRAHLARPALDRIENDPDPVLLVSKRTAEEVAEVIGSRLEHLYESMGLTIDDADPVFPFTRADLDQLAGMRTRDVLNWCHRHRENAIAAGKIGQVPKPAPAAPDPRAQVGIDLERAWEDFRATFSADVPENDSRLLEILAGAATASAEELGGRLSVAASRARDHLTLSLRPEQRPVEELFVTVCNKQARGGSLGKQIDRLRAEAGRRVPVAIRCSEFPSNPKTQIAQHLGDLVRSGGRRIVVEDADWRSMLAFDRFRADRGADPDFRAWMETERPLGQLRCLHELLHLDALDTMPPRGTSGPQGGGTASPPSPAAPPAPVSATPQKASSAPPVAAPAAPEPRASEHRARSTVAGSQLRLGKARGLSAAPVTMKLGDLATHAAFLGSTGSGKTTLALSVIEQALAAGIPAILVDRKGDLCGYASDEWWSELPHTAELATRKQRLRDLVDVALFTPGEPQGRPLLLSIIPELPQASTSVERGKIAGYAAAALGAMMGYKATQTDRVRLAILAKAIELLAASGASGTYGLDALIELVYRQDSALLNAAGHIDPKHYPKLTEALQTLSHQKAHLLRGAGDVLSVDQLLGDRGGRTALSIVSTKFLGDLSTVDFWVARFLVELAEWASRHPADELQAIVLFDEADIYLPATRKPASKEPMENLLRRARSAGLGVLLATQSPGDLDYKARDNIRTWFLGRIAEERALSKMQPLFGDASSPLRKKIPAQSVGQFIVLAEGDTTEIAADRSLLDTHQLAEDEIVHLARAGIP